MGCEIILRYPVVLDGKERHQIYAKNIKVRESIVQCKDGDGKTFTWIPMSMISSINEFNHSKSQAEIKEDLKGWL